MTNLRRMRIADVIKKVGLPRSTIYKRIKSDDFPKQHKMGASSFWFEHELDEWLSKVHDLSDDDEAVKNDAETA